MSNKDILITQLKYNMRPFMMLSEEEQQVLRGLPDNLQVLGRHGEWQAKVINARYYRGEIYRVEPFFPC